MKVVERKPVPIYEVTCTECKSKIQYKASEVVLHHITCPVCEVSLWADAVHPVKMDEVSDCEKCRWYRTIYNTKGIGNWYVYGRCLMGGCDGSQYDPNDGKDEVEE